MFRTILFVVFVVAMVTVVVWAQSQTRRADETAATQVQGWRTLSADEARVVEACGTEPPFSGKWLRHKGDGVYTCTRCNAPLFSSDAKFKSGTGWPSFDDALPGAVREITDPDGRRTEIRCARCDGHLGHVFRGEGMTSNNTRHCVNSVSLGFEEGKRHEAFFAGGCFWGVEHLLESRPGVIDVQSGYMGGRTSRPSYHQISGGATGHAETVRVVFDPAVTTFEALAKFFFEIHDPTQRNRQGPDRGEQYRSAVFTVGSEQAVITRRLIKTLKGKGLDVATTVQRAGIFWPAEDYHQDYYQRTNKEPYCHSYTPRF